MDEDGLQLVTKGRSTTTYVEQLVAVVEPLLATTPTATTILATSNTFEALSIHNDNSMEEDNETAMGDTSHPSPNE